MAYVMKDAFLVLKKPTFDVPALPIITTVPTTTTASTGNLVTSTISAHEVFASGDLILELSDEAQIQTKQREGDLRLVGGRDDTEVKMVLFIFIVGTATVIYPMSISHKTIFPLQVIFFLFTGQCADIPRWGMGLYLR